MPPIGPTRGRTSLGVLQACRQHGLPCRWAPRITTLIQAAKQLKSTSLYEYEWPFLISGDVTRMTHCSRRGLRAQMWAREQIKANRSIAPLTPLSPPPYLFTYIFPSVCNAIHMREDIRVHRLTPVKGLGLPSPGRRRQSSALLFYLTSNKHFACMCSDPDLCKARIVSSVNPVT
jgi:hypothetical protein